MMRDIPTDDFEEEAFKEISQDEVEKIKSNSLVIEVIKAKSTSIGTLTYGTASIKFRLFPNKKLRNRLMILKAKLAVKDPTIEYLEKAMYETLAGLCTEEPWKNWTTWAVFDDNAEEIGAQEILVQMIMAIGSHIEDVKNFRGKRGGTPALREMQTPVDETERGPCVT
jgi:hypothetical protein